MQQGQVVLLDAARAMAAAKLWTQDADFDGLPGVRFVAKARAD